MPASPPISRVRTGMARQRRDQPRRPKPARALRDVPRLARRAPVPPHRRPFASRSTRSASSASPPCSTRSTRAQANALLDDGPRRALPPRLPRRRGPAGPSRDRGALGAKRDLDRAGALRVQPDSRPPTRSRPWLGLGDRAACDARLSIRRAARPWARLLWPPAPRARLANCILRPGHAGHRRSPTRQIRSSPRRSSSRPSMPRRFRDSADGARLDRRAAGTSSSGARGASRRFARRVGAYRARG